jgi:hypothetical protein
VAADGFQTVVLDDLPRRLAVGETLELRISRAAKIATQLDLIDPDALELLEQIDELAVRDHRAVRIRLAADRQAQRVRGRRSRTGQHESGRRRPGRRPAQKVPSRHPVHRCLS